MNLKQLADSGKPAFRIIKEQCLHKHFLTLDSRTVEYPDGRKVEWEVAGHNAPFATVFAFNTATRKATLIVEYAQGPNQCKYSFAAGGFDPQKHRTLADTATHELSEEARLRGGTLVRLSSDSIAELKWSTNRFVPFLVLDPHADPHPRPRDAEEAIVVVEMTLPETEEVIAQGRMMLPAVQTYLMGKRYLLQNGYLDHVNDSFI